VVEAAKTDISRPLSVDWTIIIRSARIFVVGTPDTPIINSLYLANLSIGRSAISTAELALTLGSAANIKLLISVNKLAISTAALMILNIVRTPIVSVISSADLMSVCTAARFAVLARGLTLGAAESWRARLRINVA
jgi:hypothetical protein